MREVIGFFSFGTLSWSKKIMSEKQIKAYSNGYMIYNYGGAIEISIMLG